MNDILQITYLSLQVSLDKNVANRLFKTGDKPVSSVYKGQLVIDDFSGKDNAFYA